MKIQPRCALTTSQASSDTAHLSLHLGKKWPKGGKRKVQRRHVFRLRTRVLVVWIRWRAMGIKYFLYQSYLLRRMPIHFSPPSSCPSILTSHQLHIIAHNPRPASFKDSCHGRLELFHMALGEPVGPLGGGAPHVLAVPHLGSKEAEACMKSSQAHSMFLVEAVDEGSCNLNSGRFAQKIRCPQMGSLER